MAFQLTALNGEQPDVFTTKEILDILGDPVNDEIVLRGKPYRLSTFEAVGGEDGTPLLPIFRVHEFDIAGSSNPTEFPFRETSKIDGILCTLNGLVLLQGVDKDFHIDHGVFYWHGNTDLSSTDSLVIRFLDFDI